MSAERNCPRKTFKSIRKTVWTTRKRIRKTIRNAFENVLALSGRLKIFHRHFQQIQKICTKESLFSPRGSAGGSTPRFFREICRRIFRGKTAQKKSSKKIPCKIIQPKSPTHFCRAAGPTFALGLRLRSKTRRSKTRSVDRVKLTETD